MALACPLWSIHEGSSHRNSSAQCLLSSERVVGVFDPDVVEFSDLLSKQEVNPGNNIVHLLLAAKV